MKFIAGAIAALALGACATAAQEPDELVVYVDDNGKMVMTAPKGASADAQALAALMNQLQTDDPGKDEKTEHALSEGEIWRKDPDNHLTHIQSGAVCPATWSGLVRERTTIFRPDGMDVGCNYLAPRDPTVMTFYVFTIPGETRTLAEVLEESAEPMMARQPTAKEAPFPMPSPRGDYLAKTIAYANADGTKMRTTVILAQTHGWYLKIRLTCRASEAREAEQTAALALLGQIDRLQTRPTPPTARPDPV